MIEIGLLGLGTVGLGVYEIINLKRGIPLQDKDLHIKKILVKDLHKERPVVPEPGMLTDTFEDIINDDEISIVVCVTGGLEPELSNIRRSLEAGKHVVTANKEIIAEYIDELISLALQNEVNILFEASVGGGIPIINSIVETLKINRITKIQGILNGTTNYILTKIANEKRDFTDILSEAQQLGLAEADPSADVDGFDVMRKISILASMSFRTLVKQDEVHLRGIGNITLDDIMMADYFGYKAKFLGQALLENNQYSVSVTPVLINKNSVIANVNAEYNIVLIEGDIIGELCFIGKGAGKDATANSVVSDILKITAGDINYSHIRFDDNLVSYGLTGIKNEYYIRVNISNYLEFEKTVNLISNTVKKDKLIYQDGKIYFITEKLNSTDMKKLFNDLQQVSENVFYARLENNLL